MKIRLLVDMGGRWSGGAPEFDYRDGRRGDVFEVTEDAGARMVRLGYVTTDVALAGDKLPRPYGTPFWGGSPSPG
jgi:hypothetical protein